MEKLSTAIQKQMIVRLVILAILTFHTVLGLLTFGLHSQSEYN